jgi:hypothetical protein
MSTNSVTTLQSEKLKKFPLLFYLPSYELNIKSPGLIFHFGGGAKLIFLFTTVSRTALGPTQPPIQWVRGALFLGVKRPGREADHSPPSSTEVKECVELYLHFPNTLSWRGAQFEKITRHKLDQQLRMFICDTSIEL